MNEINVKYKFTIYKLNSEIITSNEFTKKIKLNILFPQMIDDLLKLSKIEYYNVYVENLQKNTWGTLFNDNILNLMEGDDFHYKWLNYTIGDIQDKFRLFNNTLNIIIDGPGIGALVGKEEGIRFVINNNEKDRHQHEPHIHCHYGKEEMRVKLDTLEIMKNDNEFKNRKKQS